MSLADKSVWTRVAFVTALAVSTLAFGFGNTQAVAINPALTLGSNLVFTAALFGLVTTLVRLTSGLVNRKVMTVAILTVVVALSALRGFGLWFVMNLVGTGGLPPPWVTALVSVSVFGPGFVLSVLVPAWVALWRSHQTRLRELGEQRKILQGFVSDSISSQTREIAQRIRTSLGPHLTPPTSGDENNTPDAVFEILLAVVRPLSHQLHREFPSIALPPVMTARASAREFLHLMVKGKPFAPIATGVFFVLGLYPRALSNGVSWNESVLILSLSATVAGGVWLVNHFSRRFLTRVGLLSHVLALLVALSALGLFVGLLPALFGPSPAGVSEFSLAGPVATVTVAVLTGALFNAREYLLQQHNEIAQRERQLELEMSQARGMLWRRNQTLATILHGPLQSTINAAGIRLSRSENAAEALSIRNELAANLTNILGGLDDPRPTRHDLGETIANVTATWDGIATIVCRIDDQVWPIVRGQPVELAIGECLIEGVYNAVKHQSPKKIDVDLRLNGADEIVLNITHPGTIAEAASHGLGTQILDYLTLEYDLFEKDGVVRFRATFPCPSATLSEDDSENASQNVRDE